MEDYANARPISTLEALPAASDLIKPDDQVWHVDDFSKIAL